MSVTDKSGQTASVMAYIMTERYRTPAVPPTSYYQGIQEGYRQNGLPVAALKKAWEHAVEEVHAYTDRINGLASKRHGGRKRHER